MARRVLFEKFNLDKRIYNLNEGYWRRKLNLNLQEKLTEENILFKNFDSNNIKIYDGNPIFTYLDRRKNKGVRIIQESIDDLSDSDLNDVNILISAWIDQIDVSTDRNFVKHIDELVIALLLTEETIDLSLKLIQKWLEVGLTEQSIDSLINSELR